MRLAVWFQVLVHHDSLIANHGASLRETEIAASALELLPEEVVVLGADGLVVTVNARWRQFAERNGAPDHDVVILSQGFPQTPTTL